MTSEARSAGRSRFPVVLTISTLAVVAICAGLGLWQLQRAAWKQAMLAKIAAQSAGAPQPIGPVLARARRGEDVTLTRVVASCAPASPGPAQIRMTTDRGEWIARVLSPCVLPGAAFDGVLVDRGLLEITRGDVNPPRVSLPAPGEVTGVLFAKRDVGAVGLARPAPYILVAERETPARPGLTPAPYVDAAGSLQYVGAYAPTWFGLAGVALCFYAALLWRRLRPS